MDRRATSALSEARQAQVNTNRQLKRQRAELEASKQALKAQLANVEKNLEAVHDRKRRSQRLAVFQPAHNEVFEIPMGADDVEGRLISDETKRALLRNARRAAEGKLEEQEQPLAQDSTVVVPSSWSTCFERLGWIGSTVPQAPMAAQPALIKPAASLQGNRASSFKVRVPGGVQRRRSPRQSPRTKRLSLRISPSH